MLLTRWTIKSDINLAWRRVQDRTVVSIILSKDHNYGLLGKICTFFSRTLVTPACFPIGVYGKHKKTHAPFLVEICVSFSWKWTEPRVLPGWQVLKCLSVILICLVFGLDVDTEQQQQQKFHSYVALANKN